MSSRVLTQLFLFACFVATGSFVPAWSDNAVPGSPAKQVKLSEILLPLSPSATAEEVASAEKEAQAIIDQLKTGASFEQLAREYSKGPTAAQGGNVGYFRRGMLAPALEEEVFNLNVGEVTRPIRTKQGLTILKITDVSEHPPNIGQASLDVLTDTELIDFGPYLSSALERIRKNWYDAMPQEVYSPTLKRGTVAVVFSIRKDGTVEGMKISTSSSDPNLDRAAWKAISSSIPFAALPAQFSKDALKIGLHFYYNPDRLPPMSLELKSDTQANKQH